jgi:hypothetical protein
MNMKVTLVTEISDHPLHKIFGGILAKSATFNHVLGRYYYFFYDFK